MTSKAVEEVKPAIALTREQLADICYSAAVQGRETISDRHRNMNPGTALNQIAEGIADSTFAQRNGGSVTEADKLAAALQDAGARRLVPVLSAIADRYTAFRKERK